ncbi:MAG: purine-binding chemotaxis protein CheW [Oligoflexus sp.]|nr:purine-binding chemotaxis protein CheW [Oligoflexus sp.]
MSNNSEIKKTASSKGGSNRFLVFNLNDESYAVPLLKVREVIAQTEITPVPYTPAHFKGVMNLRGQVISVIDMRLKFKMKAKDASGETAIIILDLSPVSLGVVVDSVTSVVALNEDQISPSPEIESSISTDYITGIVRMDGKLILILEIEKTLSLDDLSSMRKHIKSTAAA